MLSTHPPHIASELRVLISAGMQDLTGEGLCSAHHRLSLVVTAGLGAQERRVLFDAGPDPYALERNVRRMGLDFEKIEAVVLSHGHFDHSEGVLKGDRADPGNQTQSLDSPPSPSGGFCSPSGWPAQRRPLLAIAKELRHSITIVLSVNASRSNVSVYHPSPWNCLSFRLVSRRQQSGTDDLRGLFDGQRRGHEFSDILAEPALSIEQTHFLKVCPGNKWHETNTISRDCDDKLADDRHATSAFNSRDDAQYVSAFLDDH